MNYIRTSANCCTCAALCRAAQQATHRISAYQFSRARHARVQQATTAECPGAVCKHGQLQPCRVHRMQSQAPLRTPVPSEALYHQQRPLPGQSAHMLSRSRCHGAGAQSWRQGAAWAAEGRGAQQRRALSLCCITGCACVTVKPEPGSTGQARIIGRDPSRPRPRCAVSSRPGGGAVSSVHRAARPDGAAVLPLPVRVRARPSTCRLCCVRQARCVGKRAGLCWCPL